LLQFCGIIKTVEAPSLIFPSQERRKKEGERKKKKKKARAKIKYRFFVLFFFLERKREMKEEKISANISESSSHTCGECEFFMGLGDWNLCCSKPHNESVFGFLCYEDTPACALFSPKKEKKTEN
jgi:hypothetical protein